jgi:hypothetical protein
VPLCLCGSNLETALYFRGTKTGNVFALLTDYLLQYRRLSIPSIGHFELRSQPATLEFAEKRIHPPRYEVVFSERDEVDHALVEYIGQRQHLDRQAAEDRLKQMGVKLKEYLSTGSLNWAGFGELTRRRDQVFFRPALTYPAPTPVHAEKVFRENMAHNVLIGDREFQKTTEVVEEKVGRRYPEYMIISLAVLFLAILFILWHLYMNGWRLRGSSWNGFENL